MAEKNFIGDQLVGNFTIGKRLNNPSTFHIEKNNQNLFLVAGNDSYEMIPLDDSAKNIVGLFSDLPLEKNPSIYQINLINETVSVVYNTYFRTQLIQNDKHIYIYIPRSEERRIAENFNIEQSMLINKLTQEFMYNRSIFLRQDEKNSQKPRMVGIDFNAQLELEDNYVYRINNITKNHRKDFSSLNQIYGNIDFILWQDALQVESPASVNFDEVQTNDIFKAWEAFIEYQKIQSEQKTLENKYITYDYYEIKGEQIIYHIINTFDLNSHPLLIDYKDKEYASIVFNGLLPKDVDEFLLMKSDTVNKYTHLGSIVKINLNEHTLTFSIPDRFRDLGDENTPGVIYFSDLSFRIEFQRRNNVLQTINKKQNLSANTLMRLMSKDIEDNQVGGKINPITTNVLKKMFKNPNMEIKANYREAMSIALNTPDIAVIQGPPGTGKTTLIAGILARINEMDNKSYKVLVSSEQHEALKNVVNRLSDRLIPPFVSSKERNKDDEIETHNKYIIDFQTNLMQLTKQILRNSNRHDNFTKGIIGFTALFQRLQYNNYSIWSIKEELNELSRILINMEIFDLLNDDLQELGTKIKIEELPRSNEDPIKKLIMSKIEAQRTDLDVFLHDDGKYQLESLQDLLTACEYSEFLLDTKVYHEILSNKDISDATFSHYLDYVTHIKKTFTIVEDPIFNESVESAKDIALRVYNKVKNYVNNRERGYEDIIEEFLYRLGDMDNVEEIISNYSSVIASTAAQAKASLNYVDLEGNLYDYVIIDEASRANPLDLMIPMLLGIKVILIGDQKQLPHYIETSEVKEFCRKQKTVKEFNEKLLTTSLFEIIYSNLEEAYNNQKLRFRRHIRITEQHRMHPSIGNFISKEFYEGQLSNGEKTPGKINDYNIFDAKNIAVINIPSEYGIEVKTNKSFTRIIEAEKVIEIISELIKKNVNRSLEIGVLSYYNGQVDLINQLLSKNFSSNFVGESIFCNTVDSYQGREFDIVIISGVRSNIHPQAKDSLGFIHYSPSRINVSLSRAKRLMIFVGDVSTYSKTTHFSNFFDYVKRVGYFK